MLNQTILNSLILISVFISNAFAFQMNMNTLYLTAANITDVNLTLDAYGTNYETVRLPVTELKLEDNDVALYNAIVIEEATKEMLQGIQDQIEAYQKKYKVRVAYLNCQPDTKFGFNEAAPNYDSRYVVLTKEGSDLAKKYQLNGQDVVFKVPSNELVHYDVTFNDGSITPILKYNNTESYAAAIVKKSDLESIHFFTPNSDSRLTYFTSHIWIPWVNYGIIDGFRRIYFSMQVDDFFINNPWNFTQGTEYRTSIPDMKNLGVWQKDILNRMPNGSQFKVELAINGMHVLIAAKHKADITQSYEHVLKEYGYVKPLNEEGTKKWPETVDSDWDDSVLRSGDKLYDYFAKNEEAQDNFYWLTHTFSHHNLNYASFHDADMEMALNVKMADDPYLGMYKRDCYSPHSIVCPEISGLHNGHTLQAFEKNDVHFAVGDTSRPDLASGNPYIPVLTNDTFAHHDGFIIIPRQPTGIFWDCSTEEQNLELHKQRTGITDINWNDYIRHDVDSKVDNFIKMRHDPYMFHEGNLRNDDFKEIEINGVKGKFGLLQQWVELMAFEIRKYFEWPLITIKMDDLSQSYVSRLEKQQCKPVYTMVIDDSTLNISEIKVSSTAGKCTVPLLAIRDSSFVESSVTSLEQFGDEPETAWIEVSNDSPKSVKFNGDVKWNDDSYSGKTTPRSGERSAAPSAFAKFGLLNSLLICSVLLLVIF